MGERPVNTIFAAPRPTAQQRSVLLAAAYECHANSLISYINDDLLVGARDQGEDLAADVWLRVTENLDRADERVLELSWLQMIARSVVANSAADGLELLVGFTGEEPELAAAHTGQALAQTEYLYTDRLFVGATRTGMGTALAPTLRSELDEVQVA